MEELVKRGFSSLFQSDNNNDSQNKNRHIGTNEQPESDYLTMIMLSCGCMPSLEDIDPLYNKRSESNYNLEPQHNNIQDDEILDRMLSWLSRLSKEDDDSDDDETEATHHTEMSSIRDDRNNIREEAASLCSDSRSQLSKSSRVSFAFPPVTSVRSRPKTTRRENRLLYHVEDDV